MMKKTVYEAPITERFQVELEGSFCGSVDVQNPNEDNGRIEEHKVNTTFGDNGTFVVDSWDE